uniref:C2H2-type domain-containing protein n=1 Tax=Heterorhabditis bacteriophora TaxID=37862 RepID=A0A1I7XLL2_HETBA
MQCVVIRHGQLLGKMAGTSCSVLEGNGLGSKSVTCNSCKEQFGDIWTLLKHCYASHGLRICQEEIPEADHSCTSTSSPVTSADSMLLTPGNYTDNSSNKNGRAFYLKDYLNRRYYIEINYIPSRMLPSEETDEEQVASAFTSTSAVNRNGHGLVSQMAMAMQQQHQQNTSLQASYQFFSNIWMQPNVLSAMQDYYHQMSQNGYLGSLSNTTVALLGFGGGVTTPSPGLYLQKTDEPSAFTPNPMRPGSAIRRRASPDEGATPRKNPRTEEENEPVIVVDDGDLAEPAARRQMNVKKERCTYCSKASKYQFKSGYIMLSYIKLFYSCFFILERPRPTPSALADATSLLALSNQPITVSQPPPSAVSQSNQIVLNWLQALNVSNAPTSQPLASGGSLPNKEEFVEADDDMEDSEASELNERLKKVSY